MTATIRRLGTDATTSVIVRPSTVAEPTILACGSGSISVFIEPLTSTITIRCAGRLAPPDDSSSDPSRAPFGLIVTRL